MNWPTKPHSEREIATFIGCSGGRQISGMASKRFTKLEDSPWGVFFEQAVINLLKVEEGEGGGGGSPPS